MRAVTVAGFVVCAIAIVALVVQSRRRPERLAPFATLLDVVMADRAARFTILLFWWWIGWHFLVTAPMP
jgi:Mn2+/Fe2+ NRAMP family transporter